MSEFTPEDLQLSSTKPYLVRAFYDWIVDNNCTPYIIVNTEYPDVEVPRDYVENDRIILNIALRAVNNLQITNDFISFDARFSGVEREIFVPVEAIVAIYAHENGRGMVFSEDNPDNEPPEPETPLSDDIDESNVTKFSAHKKKGKPNLKIVK